MTTHNVTDKDEIFATCWKNAEEWLLREETDRETVEWMRSASLAYVDALDLPGIVWIQPMVVPVQMVRHPKLGDFASAMAISSGVSKTWFDSAADVGREFAGKAGKWIRDCIRAVGEENVESAVFLPYILANTHPAMPNAVITRSAVHVLTKDDFAEQLADLESARAEGCPV